MSIKSLSKLYFQVHVNWLTNLSATNVTSLTICDHLRTNINTEEVSHLSAAAVKDHDQGNLGKKDYCGLWVQRASIHTAGTAWGQAWPLTLEAENWTSVTKQRLHTGNGRKLWNLKASPQGLICFLQQGHASLTSPNSTPSRTLSSLQVPKTSHGNYHRSVPASYRSEQWRWPTVAHHNKNNELEICKQRKSLIWIL